MKKKIYTTVLILFGLAILLSGCGNESVDNSESTPIEEIVESSQANDAQEEEIENSFEEGFVSEEDDVDLGELI